MFYRLWCVDLRAEELECRSAGAFTSRCHIMKDKLMGSKEEVDRNAHCGTDPAKACVLFCFFFLTRNLNLALRQRGQQGKEKVGATERGEKP